MNALKNIPILMYHFIETAAQPSPYAISPAQFERQLDHLLSHGYQTISFATLYRLLENGAKPVIKPVIITFDDGAVCFYEHALRALASRRMSATVFLVAGAIGRFNQWDCAGGGVRRALMDEYEIRDLVNHGIELGAHGWSHRPLPECPPEELPLETRTCRQELEARFGQPITTFAYPYGRYGEEHPKVLRDSGYQGAVSVFSQHPTVTFNRFAMRRIYTYAGENLLRWSLKLSPLYFAYVGRRDKNKRCDQ